MNTKASLSSFISDLDNQIKEINKLKASATVELSDLIKKEKLDEFNQAISETPVNWAVVLKTDEKGQMLPEQEEYIRNHIKTVNKIVEIDSYFHDTKQASFTLKLIKYSLNQKQIESVFNHLISILRGLSPVKVHEKIGKKFRVLPVLDKKKGQKGTYSILVDEKNMAHVYREHRMKPEFLLQNVPLPQALTFIAKKHYFYD